jgi:chromosome segregation protein
MLKRAAALGGGALADALRRDPTGATGRLLATVCWVPDLASLLTLQAHLPLGWLAVVRDGTAVAGPTTIALGRAEGLLERRADVERLERDVMAAASAAADRRQEADAHTAASAAARAAADAGRVAERECATARERADESERTASRAVEALAREAAWHSAQAGRLGAEADRADSALANLDGRSTNPVERGPTDPATDGAAAALAAWEARAADVRAIRDGLAAEAGERERLRREAEATRARAEAAASMDVERIARAERERLVLADRERQIRHELEVLGAELGAAGDREARARAELTELATADAADREALARAEAPVASARDRLRSTEERLRAAEVADLEARLGLESVREGLLVDLAAHGDLGLRALDAGEPPDRAEPLARGEPSRRAEPSDGAENGDPDDVRAFDAALVRVAASWAAAPPRTEPPSPGRLAYLRRRYHELGAANPFAVEEYAEVKQRLEGLEAQERDLRMAIGETRRLIAELSTMIAEQFRTTFRALETAFDARFKQLFGGGFARLALTDPADLAVTGVEIVAQPPGKKAQALAMLSGGERALTAVALLFAMLEVRPVPFCVLDEVDAALDEANIGRFSEALRSLADRTQFIVITHNRGTIEAADALYGVTVGDDSVSRVISLRLDEATEIAAAAMADRMPTRGPGGEASTERLATGDVLA